MVVTSLMLANPPSTLAYKLRESTIDFPTSMYHGSDNKEKDSEQTMIQMIFKKENFEKRQIKDAKIQIGKQAKTQM